jgi:hypothetical protein
MPLGDILRLDMPPSKKAIDIKITIANFGNVFYMRVPRFMLDQTAADQKAQDIVETEVQGVQKVLILT